MSHIVKLGAHYLQGTNGWGPESMANEYPTKKEAEKAAPEGAEVVSPKAPDAYAEFVRRKSQVDSDGGFAPVFMPSFLFDFQAALVDWSLRKGRSALFVDTGLGKTAKELVVAENIVRHTNRPVLILTPLAVSAQTVREAAKFDIECTRLPSERASVSKAGIYVTNYERLHHLDESDYAGIICDESAILKSFSGETKKAVTRFASKMPYRLLATATPAPNDYIELGTSSEAIGGLGYTDMLTRFFKQTDAKQSRIDDVKASREDMRMRAESSDGNYFGKLSFRVSQSIGQYRMKGHAVQPFWRWVASWARACRKPSDLGPFDDSRFVLPPLTERQHVVMPRRPKDGMLFVQPAFGLQEEREERRRTLDERCELVAELVKHDRPAAVWCHMNAEGDLLEKLIPDSIQVSGATSDDDKEAAYEAFRTGEKRVIVLKPKIGAQGLNWQHCSDVVTFATHSFQDHYQLIRRCWRFGQKRPVNVDVISTEGEVRVRDSMLRKSAQADAMFTELIGHMQDATRIDRAVSETGKVGLPSWL